MRKKVIVLVSLLFVLVDMYAQTFYYDTTQVFYAQRYVCDVTQESKSVRLYSKSNKFTEVEAVNKETGAEMTDAEGNIIKAIFNKQTKEAQIYVNGTKASLDNTSPKKAPPVSASEKVIGNYKRRSAIDTYAYATVDIEQTIVWQGLAQTSYV